MKSIQTSNPHRNFAYYFNEKPLAPYLFALSKKMSDGHICINIDNLHQEEEFWEEFEDSFDKTQSFPSDSTLIRTSIEEKEVTPFTLNNNRLYLSRNFYYETKIIEKLKELSNLDPELRKDRKTKLEGNAAFVKNLQSHDKNLKSFSEEEKPDWQLVASVQGMLNNITIVTGGPGTGKTTTVAKILALLNKTEDNLRVALTAPTGKAAVRMKESLLSTVKDRRNQELGIEELVNETTPSTIHRLLGASFESVFFKHNASNPLDYNVIIVDESSMIGVALFAKLLDAVKAGTRLILLGDSEQLASVDSGSLFGDLCKGVEKNENKFDDEQRVFLNNFLSDGRTLNDNYSIGKHVSFLDQHLVRLKKTYRYKQESNLGQFTKAVIRGESERLASILEKKDESLILDEDYDENRLKEFINGYSKYIEEEDTQIALKNINKLRVLCVVRQGDQGIYTLNRTIESTLKKKYKEKEELFSPTDGFYHNQPIMVTRNMKSLHLFNGDVGIVRKDENKNLKAYFPASTNEDDVDGNGLIVINPALIPEWETVFAMTIHKSQGSEFDKVLVILPKVESHRLLTRELLYTGITRAKQKAIVQSSLELIKTTAQRFVDRVSGIQERIN